MDLKMQRINASYVSLLFQLHFKSAEYMRRIQFKMKNQSSIFITYYQTFPRTSSSVKSQLNRAWGISLWIGILFPQYHGFQLLLYLIYFFKRTSLTTALRLTGSVSIVIIIIEIRRTASSISACLAIGFL